MVFAFADCEIDAERRELCRQGTLQHVEPQVFDVLLYLITHRQRVVTKDELFQAVWNGRIVSETTLTSRISAARRAIGDTGERQTLLRTVPRLGFRFCGEVEERAQPTGKPSETGPSTQNKNWGTAALPAQSTRLIGRADEAAQIAALISNARLVSLTGVGGVGKTRLALHVAAQVAANFADGARLVALAAVGDPAAIAHAIAGALAVAQRAGQSIEQSIVRSLAGRQLLLVLDNCEHVIEAVAALVRDIIAACPQVSVLATSREALGVAGERVIHVLPLGCEGDFAPATQLFLDRAQSIASQFERSADVAVITDICRTLDGLPLAIELAAARSHMMSPSQICDRLHERFKFLIRGSRGAAERHQTLRHAVQWSYDLLMPPERMLFMRLSVFAGGFDLDAAEQIGAGGELTDDDVLDALDSLIRKSLVAVAPSDDILRYSMLETIRQFAAEQLTLTGENDATRLRHAHYFADDCDRHFKIWRSPRQRAAYKWLDREMGNLRAAFQWGVRQDQIDIASRIASSIGDMARFRVREEAANWAAEIVGAARQVRHRRLAILLTWAASTAWSQGRLDEARRYGEEAMSLAGSADFDAFAWVFTDLSMVAAYEGDVSGAVKLARAGTRQAADQEDRFCLAMLPYFLAIGGLRKEAMAASDEGLSSVETAGVPASISIALWARGKAYGSADPVMALAAYERGIAVARQSGNRFWEVMNVFEAAVLHARSDDFAGALRSFRDLLNQWRQSADLMFVSHGFGTLAVLFERLGCLEAAATLNGAVAKAFATNPFVPELPDVTRRIRNTLGEATFLKAHGRGEAMAMHEAYDYAADQVRQALERLGTE